MLITSASSPITFPPSSSPPLNGKRPRPDAGPKVARARTRGGFVVDDDSDEEDGLVSPPPAKKRQLDGAGDAATTDQRPLNASVQERELQHLPATDVQESQELPDAQVLDEPQMPEDDHFSSLFDPGNTGSLFESLYTTHHSSRDFSISTCSGRSIPVRQRKPRVATTYESVVAARSRTKEGRAKRSYYGIDIHELVDGARKELAEKQQSPGSSRDATASVPRGVQVASIEAPDTNLKKPKRSMLWTEKYRARNFMDLVGDDLTNRQVLRWLKRWDPIVFPHTAKPNPATRRPGARQQQQQPEEEKSHRKILMLAGPPGLGKTTLAHVCARQAGYEVLEINASDDRSRDVVRGRIRTTLGTESVKTIEHGKAQPGKKPKVARPVCVVVDEVDGVVSGSGGSGEGGFVKALIDLVLLDQKNGSGGTSSAAAGKRKRKGDDFRQMRPLILVCNDVYHVSLRPLRQSGFAEIVHVGKPSVDAVVTRLKAVFEKEGIPCEKDAARKVCEAAWGMTSGIDAKRGAENTAEGDLRGVMVVGEWVAGRLKSGSSGANLCLTRQWVEKNIMRDLSHGGGGARGLGRGGVKEIVTRIFQEGAGFPKQNLTIAQPQNALHEQPQTQLSFNEHHRRYAMERLREMVDTSGEVERVMTDIFLEYPNREFNDDCYLTKPNMAYEWLHFHDTCSHRIFSAQDWELGQYFSQPVLACHHLFASPHRHIAQWRADGGSDENGAPPLPFSGPRADFEAYEAGKQNRAMLQTIQAQLPPSLMRSFRSPEHVATDFLPYLVRLVSPDVKPVIIGGSDKNVASVASVRREGEKIMVRRAAEVLAEVGISLQKGKIEEANPSAVSRTQWVYRMEPDVDMLATFETAGAQIMAMQAPTRYAVRQVLDQELHKTMVLRDNAARQARFKVGNLAGGQEEFRFDDKENQGQAKRNTTRPKASTEKRDFFGRIIKEVPRALQDLSVNAGAGKQTNLDGNKSETKAWVTYHEGLNNAVKKPITLDEFLKGF